MSLLLSVDRIIQIRLNPCISIVKYKKDNMTLMWLFDKDVDLPNRSSLIIERDFTD